MAYFSNGSEGMVLDEQCSNCILGDQHCPVMLIQLLYNYDQCKKGNEQLREAMGHLVSKEGVCQVKKSIEASTKKIKT